MSALERLYQIDQMLAGRAFVPRRELQERLGVSWATLKRDLSYLRNRLNAPIICDRKLGGYRFASAPVQTGPAYELPGLWFSAAEIHALLTMQHLLSGLVGTSGLLGPHIDALQARLSGLLGSADNAADQIVRRIRIATVGARKPDPEHFEVVGSALLRRKRLLIGYRARATGETSKRQISPQRLVHYRDNWYLDAWCHWRDGLRSFSVDAIENAEILDQQAFDLPDEELDKSLGTGYGIFSGVQLRWARLRFTPQRARWIAAERWHPAQKGYFTDDGSYELSLPYADDRELLMDIMRYGADCLVLDPDDLRERVLAEFDKARLRYQP